MSSLRELLARPESRTLDRKREEVELPRALRTLVAFANTAGGTLILGVDDDGVPVGVRDPKAQEERYANAIASGIEPPLTPDLTPVEIDGVWLLLVRVPRFPGPFYLRSEGPNDGVYVRLGSTSRRATDSQREELRRQAGALAYDERPCLGASIEDVDLEMARRMFGSVGRDIGRAALETLGVFVRHGDELLPSNGGIILFGTPAARARCFPNARVRCARFAGTTKAEFLDQLDVEGTVLQALDEVPAFVRRNTRLRARIESVRREDVPEYSPVALREIVANAVAHADYSQRGMPIRVQIFDDRLEVENPGGWPIGFSEDDFRGGVSRVRNPVIARVLHELNVIEAWGSGYERIAAVSAAGGYPMPEWIEAGLVLRVRSAPQPWVAEGGVRGVPRIAVTVHVPDGTASGTANGTGKGGTETRGAADHSPAERQQWMLDELRSGRPVTARDLMARFAIAQRTARRDIEALVGRGKIVFVGPTKTGHYESRD